MRELTHYQLLFVQEDATPKDIETAFQHMRTGFTVGKDPAQIRAFEHVLHAYTILKDPEKRAAYDLKLKRECIGYALEALMKDHKAIFAVTPNTFQIFTQSIAPERIECRLGDRYMSISYIGWGADALSNSELYGITDHKAFISIFNNYFNSFVLNKINTGNVTAHNDLAELILDDLVKGDLVGKQVQIIINYKISMS